MKKWLLVPEIALFIVTAYLTYSWIREPQGNWEPWTFACGLPALGLETWRRWTEKDEPTVTTNHAVAPKEVSELMKELQSKPLSKVLPRLLEFAKRHELQEIERFATLELSGYDKSTMRQGEKVPDYRVVPGNWIDEFRRPYIINRADMAFINRYGIRSTIGQIEQLMLASPTWGVEDPEMTEIFEKDLGVSVRLFVGNSIALQGIIDNVRSRAITLLAESSKSLSQRAPAANELPKQNK